MSKLDKYNYLFVEQYKKNDWEQFLKECFFSKDFNLATGLLLEANKHYGESIEFHWPLVLCYLKTNQLALYEKHLKKCIECEKNYEPSYILLAELYAKQKLDQKAKKYFAMAYKVEPSYMSRRYFDSAPPFVKNALNLSRAYLFDDYHRGINLIVKELSTKGDTKRLERCFNIYLGREPKAVDANFNPQLLYFPDIRKQEFYSPAEFDNFAILNEYQKSISSEYKKIDEPFTNYINLHSTGSSEVALKEFEGYEEDKWKSFHLYRYGRNEANCKLCPKTDEVLQKIGLPDVDGFMPEAFFSRLAPGATIPPHYGLSNARLAVHWPVELNNDSYIEVGGVKKSWKEGEALIFDDSFSHNAKNNSDKDRTVLIFDTWHPDLTEVERLGIKKLFEIKTITNLVN